MVRTLGTTEDRWVDGGEVFLAGVPFNNPQMIHLNMVLVLNHKQ